MKHFLNKKNTFIIAEAGVNHNGRFDVAKKMVVVAKEAGCDAVKFQTFKSENLVSKEAALALYQKKNNPGAGRRQLQLLKGLELSFEHFKALQLFCTQKKILFLSTPFDFESVDFLNRLGIRIFKISSGDLTNIPFLRYIAEKKKDMILSTGMARMDEIQAAVGAIYAAGNRKLSLLHCVTEYPAPVEEMNLRAMDSLRSFFNIPVGLSDHTLGTEVAIAAVALGATIIEKHLTLDRHMTGPDHKASLEPQEFKKMVVSIRNVEKALGDGIKRPSRSEKKYIPLVRRSLVAFKDIPKGKTVLPGDIVFKRPGYGIGPKDFAKVLGRKSRVHIKKDEIIKWADVE